MPDVFPLPVEGITGSGNNTMDVRVQTQVLPPGVQHCYDPGFHTVMRVAEQAERMPNCSKEQVVIHPLVVQANGIQPVRNRKYNVVMFYRQGATHQVVNPKCLF
jgi:hypothetical protein